MPCETVQQWKVAFSAFPADGRFPSGGCWVRGHVEVEAPSAVVDVRAWVGRRMVCGYCEAATAGRAEDAPALSVGFVLFLRPPGGRHRFRLEFFDAHHGSWREGFRGEIGSATPDQGGEQTGASGPGVGWMVLRALRWRQAQSRRSWLELARSGWSAGAARSIAIHPGPPLYGCLEEPGRLVRTNHGLLSVNGWLAHATQKITRVTAFVDPRLPAQLEYGLPRSDVAAEFGDLRGAARCQFTGEVLVPVSQPQPWGLVVGADLESGEHLVAFARRLWGPPFAPDLPGELPPYSERRFGSAALAVLATGGWRALRHAAADLPAANDIYRRHASPLVGQKLVRYQTPSSSRPLPRGLSVVIVNDNLSLGGAALFAFEFACYLSHQSGWKVRLVAPQDGPLRLLCTEAGIPVEIIEGVPIAAEPCAGEFRRRVAVLAAGCGWRESDVVIVNTMVAQWAIHVAKSLKKPTLFYVHESARIDALFSAAQAPMAEAAVAGATRTVFVTEWTRSQHRHLERRGNFRLLRSWTDIGRLDAFGANHDRRALRQAREIPPEAIVTVCLGSICDRKGQRLLVRAVEQLVRAFPRTEEDRPELQFLLVGAKPSPDTDQLRADIAVRGLGGLVRLVEETPDAASYLCLADIYVCPSFEEGFPRALMEAAALGLQIVTTSVCGIPEMLRKQDAWLVPPGDPVLLSGALVQAMQAHRAGDRTKPQSARSRLEQLFNAAEVLPEHAALVWEAKAATA